MYHKGNTIKYDYFNGTYPSKHLNNQITYFDNIKRELEARKTKVANTLYRNKLKEHQTKMNYVNELHRIRSILSLNDKPLIAADVELKLNEWIHLSLVSNNNSLRLYLNNSLKAETFFEMFRNEYFDSNYIGKQNDNNLMEYTIVYDEIKIFERSLNEYELRKQTGFYESNIFKVIISLKEKAMQIFL